MMAAGAAESNDFVWRQANALAAKARTSDDWLGVARLYRLPGAQGNIGLISPVLLSLSLSFAGGAMIYVVFGELLPEAFLMWKSKAPGAAALIGTLVGLLIIKL